MAKTLAEIAGQYETDKTDSPGYIANFDRLFAPLRDEPIRLFELGVFRGGSLLMWEEYFLRGLIVGLDLNSVTIDSKADRIRFYQGRQEDTALLDRIGSETAPEGFDIIIDDAAHVGTLARISFWHLFKHHLKPGGVYVLEDWGTGYWDSWYDGAAYRPALLSKVAGRPRMARLVRFLGLFDPNFCSHNFGMVGFVKELVDECGMADITHSKRGVPPPRSSMIENLVVTHGHVFVRKKLTVPS